MDFTQGRFSRFSLVTMFFVIGEFLAVLGIFFLAGVICLVIFTMLLVTPLRFLLVLSEFKLEMLASVEHLVSSP